MVLHFSNEMQLEDNLYLLMYQLRCIFKACQIFTDRCKIWIQEGSEVMLKHCCRDLFIYLFIIYFLRVTVSYNKLLFIIIIILKSEVLQDIVLANGFQKHC